MKRLLTIFATLLVFAFAMSGVAHAELMSEYGTKVFDLKIGSSGNNGFSELRYADGKVESYAPGKYDKSATWTGGSLVYHNAFDAGDMYQSHANADLDQNKWQANTNTYYHYGYFRLTNASKASTAPLTGGTFNMEFQIKNTADKNYSTVSTGPIDFHWWENPDTGASYLIFTEVAWSLGKVTDSRGVEHNLYLQLKDQPTAEETSYTQLSGDIYNKALAGTGLADGTNLFAWKTPAGKAQYMAFSIGAYAPGADPYAAPIPGAAWLMGSGVAGLIALRRRNQK